MIEGIDGGATAVWLLGALTLAAAVADWWAVAREHRAAERIAKPATLLLLLATALAAGATESAAGLWLVVALAFGALGDIALLGESNRRFVVGLALFLVGHLSYAAAFLALGEPQARGLLVGLAALVLALVAGRAVLPAVLRDHGPGLAAPVALYTAVIGAMLVLAGGTGHLWVLVGGAVFVASDTVLALDRFARPARWRAPLPHLTVMVAYHLGQALIVYGVLA